MSMTCRFSRTRLGRLTAKAAITALLFTGMLPGATAARVVLHASDITPPEPAPPRPPIVGIADTHVHQFANLGFGGIEVWGSPVDPSLDANAFLTARRGAPARAAGQRLHLRLERRRRRVPGRLGSVCQGHTGSTVVRQRIVLAAVSAGHRRVGERVLADHNSRSERN